MTLNLLDPTPSIALPHALYHIRPLIKVALSQCCRFNRPCYFLFLTREILVLETFVSTLKDGSCYLLQHVAVTPVSQAADVRRLGCSRVVLSFPHLRNQHPLTHWRVRPFSLGDSRRLCAQLACLSLSRCGETGRMELRIACSTRSRRTSAEIPALVSHSCSASFLTSFPERCSAPFRTVPPSSCARTTSSPIRAHHHRDGSLCASSRWRARWYTRRVRVVL